MEKETSEENEADETEDARQGQVNELNFLRIITQKMSIIPPARGNRLYHFSVVFFKLLAHSQGVNGSRSPLRILVGDEGYQEYQHERRGYLNHEKLRIF